MSSKSKLLAGLFLPFAMLTLSACASNLCQRKDRWFSSTCAGSDVSYSSDPMCASNIERCDQAHLNQLEGYVACLEAEKMCSMDIIASCGQKFPGGVNLQCTGPAS